MIPASDWYWLAHPGHFIAVDSCRFRLATRVGRFLISTVGDYYPGDGKDLNEVGFGRLYETMVFPLTGESHECGCPVIAEWIEGEMSGYSSAVEAHAGHMATCWRYAAKDD